MVNLSIVKVSFLLSLACVLWCDSTISVAGSIQDDKRQRPAAQFEERPRLRVEEITDSVEADRREAMTLFAIGRMKVNEDKYADAARMFQRAHRLDPTGEPIVQQILPVAFELERPGEAVRYAVIAVEMAANPNPLLVQFLAEYYVQQGQFDLALKQYERVIALTPEAERNDEAFLRMQLVMARLYHTNEQYEQAVACFETVRAAQNSPADFALTAEQVAEIIGDEQRSLEAMAESYLEAGEVDQAAELFGEAHELAREVASDELHPQIEAKAEWNAVRLAHARGQIDQALQRLHACLDNQAVVTDAKMIAALTELLETKGQSDQIIPQLRELHAARPANTQIAVALARRLEEAGEADQSAKVLQGFLDDLDQSKDETRLSRFTALAALIDLQAERRNAAELFAAWSRLKELAETPEAFAQPGTVDLTVETNFAQELLSAAESVAAARKLTYGEAITAAIIALDADDSDAAEGYFNQAIELRSQLKADILIFWGMELLVAEQNAKAAAVFQRGVRERALPFGQPDFYYHLAGAQAMLEDYPAALNSARRAAAMAASNPRILARIAWVQYRSGDEAAAADSYQLIVRRFDDERSKPDVRDAVRQARLVLSALAVDRDDLPQAEEWLEQILDEFPDDEGALNDLGYLWADQNKHLRRAHEMIRKAIAVEPENAAYLDSLGWVLHRLGQHEEAIAHLRKSLELREEPDGDVLDHLGDAYLAAEKLESAREAWQNAIQAFDPKQEADKIQAVAAKLAANAD